LYPYITIKNAPFSKQWGELLVLLDVQCSTFAVSLTIDASYSTTVSPWIVYRRNFEVPFHFHSFFTFSECLFRVSPVYRYVAQKQYWTEQKHLQQGVTQLSEHHKEMLDRLKVCRIVVSFDFCVIPYFHRKHPKLSTNKMKRI
jgi:hypothetical protein